LKMEELIAQVEALLRAAGVEDPRAEAAWIVAAVDGVDAGGGEAPALEMAKLRARGRPLGYLVGRVRFMGLDMRVAPGSLVPRAETELLGQVAREVVAGLSTPSPRVIDMCCGSGNLACAIATADRRARVWACDLTNDAVATARLNVEQLRVADRVTVLQGDLFDPLVSLGLERSIDVIVCNPPYISSGRLAKDRAELIEHEPREAFDGGPYGLSTFQRVVRDALTFLKPAGALLFEVGEGQARQVALLFDRTKAYEPTTTVADASGVPRVVLSRTRGS
jgi:release factor glutamine methyltransferase